MMKTSFCRACGAEIGFIKTKNGKTIPVNPEQIQILKMSSADGVYVTPDGEVVHGKPCSECTNAGKTEQWDVGYISHFATCPEADKFRKRRKSDRKNSD